MVMEPLTPLCGCMRCAQNHNDGLVDVHARLRGTTEIADDGRPLHDRFGIELVVYDA
jgi:hypothetical protein